VAAVLLYDKVDERRLFSERLQAAEPEVYYSTLIKLLLYAGVDKFVIGAQKTPNSDKHVIMGAAS